MELHIMPELGKCECGNGSDLYSTDAKLECLPESRRYWLKVFMDILSSSRTIRQGYLAIKLYSGSLQ